MPSNLQTFTYTLLTGSSSVTGTAIDPEKSTLNTIYYLMSGASASSQITFVVEARDPVGNWGYIVDYVQLTGSRVNSISTFNTPITNGLRGSIQNISNASGSIYLDSSY